MDAGLAVLLHGGKGGREVRSCGVGAGCPSLFFEGLSQGAEVHTQLLCLWKRDYSEIFILSLMPPCALEVREEMRGGGMSNVFLL